MYGINAVVKVKGTTTFNSFQKQFNGISLGAGMDIRIKPLKIGYISAALLYPMPNKELDDYILDLKKNHSVQFYNEPSTFVLSLGFTFILNRSNSK